MDEPDYRFLTYSTVYVLRHLYDLYDFRLLDMWNLHIDVLYT